MTHDGLAWYRQLAIPTRFSCQIDNDGAGLHCTHTSLGDEHGGTPAWHECSRDDRIGLRSTFLNELALARDMLLRELLCIATRVFCFLVADIQLDERGAQTLDLLLYRRPRIERFDERAEPAGGGDCLQARDTGAQHQHACRRNRSRSRHEHGKKATHLV